MKINQFGIKFYNNSSIRQVLKTTECDCSIEKQLDTMCNSILNASFSLRKVMIFSFFDLTKYHFLPVSQKVVGQLEVPFHIFVFEILSSSNPIFQHYN